YRRRAHAATASRVCRVDAAASDRLGQQDRPGHRRADRTDPRAPPPSAEIETCRRCGGRLRVIASIEAPATIERILAHLGRDAEPVDPASPSRAPPQGEFSFWPLCTAEPPRRGRAGLGLRPDARAFLDGTRRFAQHITPDPGGSALTSGLGGRPSRLDGSTSAHIWALIRIIRPYTHYYPPGPVSRRRRRLGARFPAARRRRRSGPRQLY